MAPSPRRNVADDVRQFLEETPLPCSYCDACLALHFETSLEEARAIALALADSPDFIRKQHKCDGCGRPIEVTAAKSKRRR